MYWAKCVEPYQSPTAVTWSGPGAIVFNRINFSLSHLKQPAKEK
jgi:hypothetical protein